MDADGLVNFERAVPAGGCPRRALHGGAGAGHARQHAAGVSEDARQQIINVTLAALGRSVGGTPEAIVADATRKQAALQEFRQTRGDQLVDLTSAARGAVSPSLQREIEKSQAIIEKAKRQYDTLTEALPDRGSPAGHRRGLLQPGRPAAAARAPETIEERPERRWNWAS